MLKAIAIATLATAGLPASMDTALSALRREPKIMDMTWQPSAKVLYLGMASDGTPRHGYAQYVCEVLAEHGAARGVTVRVIDISTVRQGVSNWRRMGEASCR